MGSPDAHLVTLAQAGDEQAFAVLYRRYARTVYSLARHLLGDDERAMDVTQEVFVKAWQALPRLREADALPSWLRIITTNIVRDHGRRRKPEVTMTDQESEDSPRVEVADGSCAVADSLIHEEIRRAVREAVVRLPEPQRIVIIMHHFEDRPVAEIAAELRLPLGTVLSRLARGREALRRRLAPHLENTG